jgi:hypothetical protein
VVEVCSFLLVLGTLAGLTLLFLTANEFIFPLASFVLFFPLVYYLAHASLRFRHPIDPILVLLSAIAFTPLLRFLIEIAFTRRFRRKAPARAA